MWKKLLTFDNVWKLGTTLLLVGGLYLNSHYVTIQKFEAMKESNDSAHCKITDVLNGVNTSVSLLMNQQKLIDDIRIRQQQVVVDVSDLKARVLILEKKTDVPSR